MGENKKQHLKDLIKSFDTAMFITRSGESLHARPMAIAGTEEANILWFVTSNDSPKIDELKNDSRASATFQSSSRFVGLSGNAALVTDRWKIIELWKPAWKAWFKDENDPTIVLIRVVVKDAEFWDNAGTRGIRYAFEAVKAALTGTEPDPIEGIHGRIDPRASKNAPPSSHRN